MKLIAALALLGSLSVHAETTSKLSKFDCSAANGVVITSRMPAADGLSVVAIWGMSTQLFEARFGAPARTGPIVELVNDKGSVEYVVSFYSDKLIGDNGVNGVLSVAGQSPNFMDVPITAVNCKIEIQN